MFVEDRWCHTHPVYLQNLLYSVFCFVLFLFYFTFYAFEPLPPLSSHQYVGNDETSRIREEDEAKKKKSMAEKVGVGDVKQTVQHCPGTHMESVSGLDSVSLSVNKSSLQ